MRLRDLDERINRLIDKNPVAALIVELAFLALALWLLIAVFLPPQLYG